MASGCASPVSSTTRRWPRSAAHSLELRQHPAGVTPAAVLDADEHPLHLDVRTVAAQAGAADRLAAEQRHQEGPVGSSELGRVDRGLVGPAVAAYQLLLDLGDE